MLRVKDMLEIISIEEDRQKESSQAVKVGGSREGEEIGEK